MSAAPETWAVWRQDDHGNRFIVESGRSRRDAEQIAASLEAAGHKQLYWAERAPRTTKAESGLPANSANGRELQTFEQIPNSSDSCDS